ncbi:uncharacterized protein LOC104452110 [Eucalyptus grandis]|uniref:uncharacterized protein LOC104452110 n=1 Tax=Eucalyptus grandis TaxID=71139 RepID=UPI00192ECC77|nr:uncharacterized protein LOC104452110 [Eucalyptus grandis]
MENKPIFIVKERKELMLSPNRDARPALRTGHFLQPSATEPDPPPLPSTLSPPPEKLPINVKFNNWRCPTKNWTTWVDRMESMHGVTWKRAGIYDAIKCSTFLIRKHTCLVLALAQNWCPDTNTFVFPWGEATVTLEDVTVLGGYSVWGSSPVLSHLRSLSRKVEMKLKRARSEISKTPAKKADACKWMEKFRDAGSDIEHEAFLTFWLSRFVFPCPGNVISKGVLPMAINLARGVRIALAPAVLARIYRDLRKLKNVLDGLFPSLKDGNESDAIDLKLWAQFALVQVWAWERFVAPIRPREVQPGEPTLGRWHKSTKMIIQNVDFMMGEAEVLFKWRPYSSAVASYAFYGEKGKWVSLEEDADGELRSFARCLMARELPGLDFVEKYSPHRVAMQFGMDQDMPGRVAPCNQDPEIAWDNYSILLQDVHLYIPARLYEPCITARYAEWASRSSNTSMQGLKGRPGVNDDLVPPGFRPKSISVDTGDSSENDDSLTLGELLRSKRRRSAAENCSVGDCNNCSGIDQMRSSSLQNAEKTDIEMRGLPMEPEETNRLHLSAAGGAQRDHEKGTNGMQQRFPEGGLADENVGESSECLTCEMLAADLEARISKLERAVAEQNAWITK